jgi:hypothetical protein
MAKANQSEPLLEGEPEAQTTPAELHAFELCAEHEGEPVNALEFGGPDGSLVRIESGTRFETDHPSIAAFLDEHPMVKRIGGSA